jgi:hypothetical protein
MEGLVGGLQGFYAFLYRSQVEGRLFLWERMDPLDP